MFVVTRRIWYERKLKGMSWKISYDEVNLYNAKQGMLGSMVR